MRQRTTWNTNEILNRTAATSPTAATTRTADPYAMNQDHIKQQPSADKYLTGDPSAFAEDITTPNNWEVEYSGGAVKRNEIGMPEDRPETFNHPEKTASVNHDLLLKKADMTVRIARRMLGANAPEGAIEEQAASLMHLPDAEVINTYNRMAGEMPPALKEHMEQKQQGAKQEQAGQEQEAQEQAKQAAIRGDKRAFDAAVARLVQIRLANGQQQPPAQQQAGQQQQGQAQQQAGQQQGQAQQQAGQDQQSAWYDTKAPRPGHPGPDTGPYAGQQQQAQGQQAPMMQQQGQGQQQMPPAQAGQQQFPGGQFPTAQGQQAPMQQQAQGQAPAQGVEAQVQQMIEQAAQQMQQGKQANDPQQAPAQQQQAGQQQQAQGQQAPAQQQAGQQQQAQGQQAPMQQQGAGYQQQAQGQQQPPAQQQAGQQQQAMGYQQQSGLQNPNQNISPNYQQQQAGQQQGMPVQASDDQLIDQMLMPSGGAPAAGGGQIAEMDIQMEAPSMDIGDVSFQPGEDDMLRQLFSNDEAMAAQQAQSAQEQQGQAQQGQVQANIRTAALRTVGTRPTAGVARIGGAGAPPSRGQEVDKLTSLWQSAPDVREVFGLKTT